MRESRTHFTGPAIPVGCPRRSRLGVRPAFLVALVALVALVTVLPSSSPADAAPPPPAHLFNLDLLDGAQPPVEGFPPIGTAAPTNIFQASLGEKDVLLRFERQAVQDTVRDHGLSSSDSSAAQTWGRSTALAELWALILQAVQTPNRSPDQAVVAGWMQHVLDREATVEGYYAAQQLVRWAGFDTSVYDSKVATAFRTNGSSDWGDLKSFLQGAVDNPYTLDGWCRYQSPSDDKEDVYHEETKLDGEQVPECGGAGLCHLTDSCAKQGPPGPGWTPSVEDFVTWGVDVSYKKLVKDANLVALLDNVGSEAPYWSDASPMPPPGGFAAAFSDDTTAAEMSTLFATITPGLSEEAHLGVELAGEGAELGATILTAAGVSFTIGESIGLEIPGVDVVALGVEVAFDIALAITDAVEKGNMPSEFVALLKDGSQQKVSDVASTPDGRESLFSLFLASTLPQPLQDCTGSATICLGQPPVVPADDQDTPFFVSVRGDGTVQSQPTDCYAYGRCLTFYDTPSGTCQSVYLRGGWFVDTATPVDINSLAHGCGNAPAVGPSRTFQTLSITYTDWDSHEETAWILPTKAGGNVFVVEDRTADADTQDPGSCSRDGRCGISGQIYYRDFHGADKEAVLNGGEGVPAVAPCSSSCGASSGTTTALSWNPPLPTSGFYVTLSAAVSRDCPVGQTCPAPTGTVSFVLDQDGTDHPICSSVSVTSGTATCDWNPGGHADQPALAGGVVYATFLPPSTNGIAGSQAGAYVPVSEVEATTTSATASPTSARVGGPVSITATVSSFYNTSDVFSGYVTFTSGGKTLCGEVPTGAFSRTSVTCPVSFDTAGRHDIVASFHSPPRGDTSRASPSQGSASVTVSPGPTQLTVLPVGRLVARSATPVQVRVSANGVPTAAITGSLTVEDANDTSNTSTCPVSDGLGTCSFTPSAAGALTLGASFTYDGDAQYGDLSASTTAGETVTDPDVTVTVTGGEIAGGAASFSYRVTGGPDFMPLTGTLVCTQDTGGNPLSSLPPGKYTVNGDTCSGLSPTLGGQVTNAFHLDYAGLANGFFVYENTSAEYIVTVTGNQVFGGPAKFDYDVTRVPSGTVPPGDLSGSVSCTGLDGQGAGLDGHFVGQYRITGPSCSGLSDVEGAAIEYVGGTFTVTPELIHAKVTGSQAYGGAARHFFATTDPDVESGAVTCTTVDNGTPITDTMSVAGNPYTIDDGSNCSGLSTFAGNWQISYSGIFAVSPVTAYVLPSGSQTYGHAPNQFTYLVATDNAAVMFTSPAHAGIKLGGTLSCRTVGGTRPITPTMPPNTYGQLGGCSGLSDPAQDYAVQYVSGDNAAFTVSPHSLKVSVTGAKTVGGTPVFSYGTAETVPAGSLGGSVYCSKETAGESLSSLSPGVYSIDPGSCSGLVSTDGGYQLDYRGSTFTVSSPATVMPQTAPHASVGLPYTASFQISGGTPPYTIDPVDFNAEGTGMVATSSFDASTGTLTITGSAPTHAGTALFNITGQDASGAEIDLIGVHLDVLQQQTINVTTHAPQSAVYASSFTVDATASSGLPVVFSSSGACSNQGPTFTMTSGTGTCTVDYDRPGNGSFGAGAGGDETVNAGKASQSITVTTHAPATATNGSSFTVAAHAPGGVVSFSSSGSCSNAGNSFTMTSSTGSCAVTYQQAGSADYNAAPQVTDSVTAASPTQSQAITVTTHAPASAVYGSSFTVAATGGGSGNPVTFSSSGACSNNGKTFTMTSSTGTCRVMYDQAGSAGYDAAPEVTESVIAAKAGQTIVVIAHAPASAVFGSTFTVAALGGGSVNPVTLSVSGACSILAGMVTMTSGTGTCTVKYDQAGDDNYNPAPQVTDTVSARKASQTITFTSTPPNPALIGGSYTPAASGGGSGNPVVIKIDAAASTPGACLITNGTVTFTGLGNCVVDANQNGNGNYTDGAQVQQSFTVTVTDTVRGILHGSMTVSAGQSVLLASGSTVSGSVTVNAGGSLVVDGAKITGSLTASGATLIRICGTSMTSPTITNTTGRVVLGDDDGPTACDGNKISGAVTITGGHGAVEFDGNTVTGSLTITGNSGTLPPPDSGTVDAVGNKVSGKVTIQP